MDLCLKLLSVQSVQWSFCAGDFSLTVGAAGCAEELKRVEMSFGEMRKVEPGFDEVKTVERT